MLLAEINGKYVSEAQQAEDYLTSTVFGHLRYVPPGAFWQNFLAKAKTLKIEGVPRTLTNDTDFSRFECVSIHFWLKHKLGEPEMVICFSGGDQPTVCILVEVKLDSGKSGERDQLVRYLELADRLHELKVDQLPTTADYVLYLTPRESSFELEESLKKSRDSARDRQRLFRVQWQDMNDAIDESLGSTTGMAKQILEEIREFLVRRGLEYFNGYQDDLVIPDFGERDGTFYQPSAALAVLFTGMTEDVSFETFIVKKGAWIQ